MAATFDLHFCHPGVSTQGSIDTAVLFRAPRLEQGADSEPGAPMAEMGGVTALFGISGPGLPIDPAGAARIAVGWPVRFTDMLEGQV